MCVACAVAVGLVYVIVAIVVVSILGCLSLPTQPACAVW